MNIAIALSFIEKVLPPLINPDGNWVLCSMKKRINETTSINHKSIRNLKDAENYFKYELKKSKCPETYFALAEFRYNLRPQGRVERKASQAYNYRSLGFDIDCGENKPYKDYNEGLVALEDVMMQIGIIDYMVIMSGSGIHCYILLNEVINKKTWIEMSTTLGCKLNTLGLKYDKSKIKEAAMLLRVPGTYNLKKSDPVEVKILKNTEVRWEPCQLDELFERIKDIDEETPVTHRFVNLENKGTWETGNADHLVIKEKCNQIKQLTENANDEPLWYAGIGVAAGCQDPIEAAKLFSINSDKYNEVTVRKKLSQYKKSTTGPSTCNWFFKLNPDGCKGCEHKGFITTPVQLGKMNYTHNLYQDFDTEIEANLTLVKSTKSEVLFIPEPYFMNKEKNICREIEGETHVICKYPVYVSQIATLDDERRPLLIFTLRYKVPHKDWQSLPIEAALLMSVSLKGESLGAILINAGFIFMDIKDLKKLQTYILYSLNARQDMEATAKIIAQYGWTKEGSFVLGDKELNESITTICTAKDKSLADMNQYYTSEGNLEQWVLLSNAFLMPDMEIHAFSLFTAFAAPLMQMSNIGACMINLQNEDTGIGKSTMGFWGQSIYGNPYKISSGPKDTPISSSIKLGLMNNIPLYIDEISKWNSEEVSDFVYSVSTGQEKQRADRDAQLKIRNRWNTLVITSSNPSLYDLLDEDATTIQGTDARLFEIPFPKNEIFIGMAGKIALSISLNYGHAGIFYLKELVRRRALGELQKSVQNIRQQYEATFNFHFLGEERFIFTAIGLSWLGAKIAQEIGLINDQINLKAIFDKINHLVLTKRKKIISKKEGALDAINQFITQNHKNFVKVKRYGMGSTRSEGTCPNEALFGRIQLLYASEARRERPEGGYISISIEEFRKFCKNTKRAYSRLELELSVLPSFKRHNINLASGVPTTLNQSDSPQLPINCFSFEVPLEMLDTYKLEKNVSNELGPYGV